ncbi:MAG: ATP-binding cassette domain-containing protein [Spirochaetia bacterium]|nr:ATP-binding cassette domain-containing protein [Spirochaetia bacterium]
MIITKNISLNYGNRVLFENVNVKFFPGNCYGLIGANGAGKSTFLKILSGENQDYRGEVEIQSKSRMSVLKQDHHEYDNETVIQTVMMGNSELMRVMNERDEIYAKPDFSDEDGIKAGELEEQIEAMGGYEAEATASQLLDGLGVKNDLHKNLMSGLKTSDKVKTLLAQALFGDPDILLLDEPTNNIDIYAIRWLEEFLINFSKTVIVVSHDRHFLNKICTHMADIDYGKITIFTGNYDFWYESSQIIRNMARDQKRKAEEKAKELKDFIARFSANASKSKQATARKKALDRLNLDDLKASTRKFPFIDFKPEREIGNKCFSVEGISKTVNNKILLDNVTFEVNRNDKIALVGDEIAITALFNILMDIDKADSGKMEWGITAQKSYFPAEHKSYFNDPDLSLVSWLRQYSKDQDESYIRGFLGRMLFSGDESMKKVSVLSGGEKVRMMTSRMMLSGANVLILDGPTAHLDLETIQAFNDGLCRFTGVVLFSSHDQQFVETVANRIFEIKDGKLSIFNEGFETYVDSHAAK